ncbi:DMT family transporter [Microbacterium album]|uniref:Membrane protein n=1 Tax=Microbacterium album TaxID=2053191 RepID=A0A917MLY5_9MICO|nr:DMT family transporter [Microbacterium album]GGH43765.1 membrane protein [Microbacterium album]
MRVPAEPSAPRGRRRGLLPVAGAVGVGLLTAIQSRVNGGLGAALENGVMAALVSFGSGFVIMVVVVAALPSGRAGMSRLWRGMRARDIPWWILIGGAAGALTTGAQGAVVGVIGTALFTVGVVAGQTLNGLVLDRAGYSPSGVTAVTMPRVAGVALALAAVGVALTGGTLREVPLWMLLLPVLVGAALAWQQATNGRLQRKTASATAATFVNFAGGTLVLGVVAVVQVPAVGVAPFPAEPWLYLGGALGVVYIAMSAALAPRIGVLLLTLGSVFGMLVGSLVLDALWPPAVPPSPWRSAATVLIAGAGVAVTALARRPVR